MFFKSFSSAFYIFAMLYRRGFIFQSREKTILFLSLPKLLDLCFFSCPLDILSSFFSIKFPAQRTAMRVSPLRVVSKDYSAETKTFRLVSHNSGLCLSPLMVYVYIAHDKLFVHMSPSSRNVNVQQL